MKLKITTLVVSLTLLSCKDGSKTSTSAEHKPQTVVVEKIGISHGKYQEFIVSGENFEFETRDLTFNVNDTIIIKGDIAFPKYKPNNSVEIN